MRKYSPLILALCFLLTTCIAQETDSSYIFTSPRSLKIGGDNQLQFLRFGCTEDDSINVKLFYTENYNGNETLAVENNFALKKGERYSYFNLKVPRLSSDNYYNGRLQINGSVCGNSISGSDKVSFSTPKSSIIIIQTDKPLYKPGQTVKFRVLKLDKHLKPSENENDVADVYIEDPKGTRLFQFNKVALGKGMVQNEFPLSDEPVKGRWNIIASQDDDNTERTYFEVKEYVLPKFEVKIKFPSFVLANAEVIPIEICAKYTYGKSVTAKLNLNVSLESYSYSWNRDKNPVLQETIGLDGCYNYTLNVSLIEPDNTYRYRRIMVVANVIEKGTDVQINSTQYLSRQYSPLSLNFNSDRNQRQYFKPGLPFNGKLQVTNPDDSPAAGEAIQICATVSRQRVIYEWWGNRKVKFCRNYTSDENGFIKYTIPPQNVDSVSIQLEAKSLKYVKQNGVSGPKDNVLNEPRGSMSLSPFYSPSGSFIQLATIGRPVPCGSQQPITLLFTSKDNAEYKFYYEVVKQGVVVQSGTKEVSFSIGDDVSAKYQDADQLVNESEIQIIPAPKSSESSSSSSSSEEDCPAARESKYVPPIGEVNLSIDTDANLSPSFHLLVFYIRDDNETVADSQRVEIEKCFKNKVDFQFGDEEQQPGRKTTVEISASANSLCGLKIVDKSISLMDSNDQLTKNQIFQLLENMDTNIYYSTNPCNEDIPQPGLYSSKYIIPRPPGPYYTSSYEDSFASFQDAGYLVISNLLLFTRPCKGNGGGGYSNKFAQGGIALEDSMGFAGAPAPAPVALASVARRPASTGIAHAKVGVVNTKSAVEVRNYFPETWLFDLQMTGDDGKYVSKEKLPDTITEWVGSAVCVNSKDGLGLSDSTSIRGFQAFFISYTLPVSVIRGEQFHVVVSIFNYVDDALPITVTLVNSEGLEVVGDSIDGDICIQPQTSSNLKLRLKATAVGKINITVKAETKKDSNVCSGSSVYSQIAYDSITQSLNVEAEGFPAEKVKSILFCPTDKENQMFTDSFDLSLPDDVVPDSARAYIDVTGNVLGPAIQNLNNLVVIPTGCGEQNMVKFTPNYLVLDYLTDIGKLTNEVKSKAIRNLNTGYQRELNYRHSDGSFSAFGEVDKEGSMFLTAFVLRSFYEAQRYISIDKSLLTSMQNFIASKQQEDGCFPNIGRIIDTGFQGGLEKEKNSNSITAYVLASLLISKYENQTVIEAAVSCLKNENPVTPYETFLYTYAEALGGDHETATKRIADIKPFANTTDGIEYYNNPNGTNALNLETAAYAILSSLQLGNGASDSLPLVRYMTQNLNPRGGFYSTQDTVIGLDALSKYAKLVYKDPVDILVKVAGGLEEKVEISEDNKLLIQRNKVSKVPGDLKIEATGSGCGLVQTSLRYNTKTPPQEKKFLINVAATCTDGDCKRKKITTVVSYLPEGKKAGMSVVQIKMVSGTVPVRESLDQLLAEKKNNILRFDVENNEVILYFPELSNTGNRFSFDVEEVIQVENAHPGTAKVFDYYVPENSGTTSYTFGSAESSSEASESSEP